MSDIQVTDPDVPVQSPEQDDWRSGWSFETAQIHSGAYPDPVSGARATPIYQTSSYDFGTTERAENLFNLSEVGFTYSRLNNPTQDVFEQRIAELEGGVVSVLVASGQAAEALAILTIAGRGDHVVASSSLYGGTYNLLRHTLPKFGIEVSFVYDPDDLDEWSSAVRPNTKLFFGESIGNPRNDVLDIRGVSDIAHRAGVPLIVDNTVATPYLLKPIEHGADIVVHSATKYLGGHGTVIAGVVVDSGRFDFSAHPNRFAEFVEPDPSYNNLAYWPTFGPGAYAVKLRVQLLRDLGPAISPFSSFLLLQGVETLSLRVERHVGNAKTVAEWLEQRPEVARVHYAGLPSSPWHERAREYLPRGAGAVVAFELDGGVGPGRAFVDALQLHSHVANIGDVRSLVIHPASTTHSQLTPEEQLEAGVTPGLVRLSVGLEGIDDIIADLERGFRAAADGSESPPAAP